MYLDGKYVNLILKNAFAGGVPDSPMISADAAKAAHKLVKVVDATINRIKPLRGSSCQLQVSC
jgi:hypothetical protein